MVQALPSSHVVGQAPSQTSPGSIVSLPQDGEQSLSETAVQPAGQHASSATQLVRSTCAHVTLQRLAWPKSVSWVHALSSAHWAGQLPSQVSPASTARLPHDTEQSPSVVLVQPAGQQPSPETQPVRAACAHAALQEPAAPAKESMVQALPSPQVAGQLPSQVSPGSTTPSPHEGEQSLSEAAVQPAGQQPSSDTQLVRGVKAQAALHACALPVRISLVQAMPSSHVAGHAPSQISWASTTPLPQDAEQSSSVVLLHPAGQQPSPAAQPVRAACVQAALHDSLAPVIESTVQAMPSSQDVGQSPSQVSPASRTPLPHDAEQSSSEDALQPAGQHPS